VVFEEVIFFEPFDIDVFEVGGVGVGVVDDVGHTCFGSGDQNPKSGAKIQLPRLFSKVFAPF
jgi:hypothetical protein